MSNIPPGAGALLGQRVGHYDIVALLALGGTAEIYLARVGGDSGFEKYVVVKCLHDHLADDEEFVKMFIDEARLASNLSHSNIAQTMELGSYGSRYYMVMEYLVGLSLAMIIRRGGERFPGGVLPIDLSLNMVRQACAGLHYAHEHRQNGQPLNIVHRDISPQNLVVTFEGVVKVVDFGIAKAELRETQTKSGTIKGKFAYMSPEQCVAQSVDRRTDVFALGIILHEMLTGKRLFKRPNPYDTYQAVLDCKILAPSKLNHDLDPALDALVMKALTKDKEQRYETAEVFGEAISHYLHQRGKNAGASDVARFFEQHFSQEIEEHVNRMKELVTPETGDDAPPAAPSPPVVVSQGPGIAKNSAGNRTDSAKPLAVPAIPPVGSMGAGAAKGGAVPSMASANAVSSNVAAKAAAIPSLAKPGGFGVPASIKPVGAIAGAVPPPKSQEVAVTNELVLDERSSRGELSQFVSGLPTAKSSAQASGAAPAPQGGGSSDATMLLGDSNSDASDDELPSEATRIEANPELFAQLNAAEQASTPAARASASRFPDVANLSTQIAPEGGFTGSAPPVPGAVGNPQQSSRAADATEPPPLGGPRANSWVMTADSAVPQVAMPIGGQTPRSQEPQGGDFQSPDIGHSAPPPGNAPWGQPGANPAPPEFGGLQYSQQSGGDHSEVNANGQAIEQQQGASPNSPFGYPPDATRQPPLQPQPGAGWLQQNWAGEGTGPAAPFPSSLGAPLSGQFRAQTGLPHGAQMMSPVGEQYPQRDWAAAAAKPARAVPIWILVLLFFVTLAVSLTVTVAIRKILA